MNCVEDNINSCEDDLLHGFNYQGDDFELSMLLKEQIGVLTMLIQVLGHQKALSAKTRRFFDLSQSSEVRTGRKFSS